MQEIKQQVEEIGIFFEQTTLTPMEARVFALLLLADPPELDFFAIQQFLQASKSTISNALKRLMTDGRVDYITKPGDRRRYFRISAHKWLEQIQETFANISPYVTTLNKVLELRRDSDSPQFNADLRHIQDYFRYLERELPLIKAKWEEQ